MFTRKTVLAGCAAAVMAVSGAVPALAQTPKPMGQFKDWSAFSYQSDGSTVCYAITYPQDMQPANVDHGDNFFLVTQWSNRNVNSEPQFMAGYMLHENENPTVTVDGKEFTLFSKDKSAWVENAAEEPALIAAMKSGSKMTVKATSRRGTHTSYEFSLIGVSAALDAIDGCK